MNNDSQDPTEHQSLGGQATSKKLSVEATTPPADVPGYRLTQFLGAGAFGQVWVGRDLNTGRDVAVKFYLHRGGVNWSLLSREVKNLVQMSADRYVVQVLEVGWDVDPPFYVIVKRGGVSVHLSEREDQSTEIEPCHVYISVSDVDAVYKACVSNDLEIATEPEDQDYGIREFDLVDPNGHFLTFGQDI